MSPTRRAAAFVGALALLGTLSSSAHAQRLGIMAGATFANLQGTEDVKLSNRTGSEAGISLQFPLGSAVTLQPEAWFIQKGAKFQSLSTGANSSGNVRLDYMEIPVLLRYDFSREVLGPHIYAGPTIGFNVGCSIHYASSSTGSIGATDCNTQDFKPKSLDYGVTAGAGLDFNLGGIGATAGARYGIGLADIRSDNSTTFRNRVHNGVLSLYVGVGFGKLGK